jgi:hypothetical protein
MTAAELRAEAAHAFEVWVEEGTAASFHAWRAAEQAARAADRRDQP